MVLIRFFDVSGLLKAAPFFGQWTRRRRCPKEHGVILIYPSVPPSLSGPGEAGGDHIPSEGPQGCSWAAQRASETSIEPQKCLRGGSAAMHYLSIEKKDFAF